MVERAWVLFFRKNPNVITRFSGLDIYVMNIYQCMG
jgi:hypothetical protein